jgi:nicotinamidase-related amidase
MPENNNEKSVIISAVPFYLLLLEKERKMSDWKMDGKPALLIMHMMPKMKAVETEVLKEFPIIPRQQALLKAFRSKKLPVIFVNLEFPLPMNEHVQFPAYGNLWQHYKDGFTYDRGNAEVIPELAPQPGETWLLGWPFDAFNNSGLDQILKLCGAQTLVMAGFAAQGVVYGALQAASDRYYSIIVPRDASAGPSAAGTKMFMDVMAPEAALVTTTDDIIAHL